MTYLARVDGMKMSTSGFPGGIAEGASIRTPCGGRRIDLVRPGDLIVTRDDGLQPVRIVWKKTVTAAEISADPSLAPIRLKPRAVGPMMPQRDLLLAPDHRILVPGYRVHGQPENKSCLIEARDLAGISDEAFVDRSAEEVTFYHLIFDRHLVFTASGLPAESFHATPEIASLLGETHWSDLTRHYPHLTREPEKVAPSNYAFVAEAQVLPAHA